VNPTLLRAELLRVVRNKRTVIFSAIFPAVFFLLFTSGGSSSGDAKAYLGLSAGAYVMSSMLTYAGTAALLSVAARISAERATGWNRTLRLTGLRGRTYLLTKVVLSYAIAVPGLVIVIALAASVRHVHLPGGRWVELVVSVVIGLAPIAALGVWVGYIAKPDSMQVFLGLGGTLLAFAGGQFIPIGVFGSGLQHVLRALPSYWSTQAGRSVILGSWLGWEGVGVLAGWTLVFGACAARAYRRDSAR